MRTIQELLAVYRGRFDATMDALQKPSDDLKERLVRLAPRNASFWYKDRGEEKLYRLAIAADAEGTLAVFREARNRLLANHVDTTIAWSVLMWSIRLFTWAAERGDWKPVREHSVTLESIFGFFEEVESSWIRTGQSGLLETRFKPEFPLAASGELWYSSSFNGLWAAFLCLFNVFCNRTGNLRFASRSQDVLDSVMEAFHSFFWDKRRSELALLVHPERERKVFSGLTAFITAYDPAGLLFKNRKKRMLEVLERDYYTERGVRIDAERTDPSLLPVFWESLFAFYGLSGRTVSRVEKLILEHVAFVDPGTFAKGDAEYERGMVAVLRMLVQQKQ